VIGHSFGKGKTGLNILDFQSRILVQDLAGVFTRAQEVENGVYGESLSGL
jgi:hypothetical protein